MLAIEESMSHNGLPETQKPRAMAFVLLRILLLTNDFKMAPTQSLATLQRGPQLS